MGELRKKCYCRKCIYHIYENPNIKLTCNTLNIVLIQKGNIQILNFCTNWGGGKGLVLEGPIFFGPLKGVVEID